MLTEGSNRYWRHRCPSAAKRPANVVDPDNVALPGPSSITRSATATSKSSSSVLETRTPTTTVQRHATDRSGSPNTPSTLIYLVPARGGGRGRHECCGTRIREEFLKLAYECARNVGFAIRIVDINGKGNKMLRTKRRRHSPTPREQSATLTTKKPVARQIFAFPSRLAFARVHSILLLFSKLT